MMDSIQDRIGVAKVKTFLNDFGKALALVEEGNQITQEVHDVGDKVRFHLEVCNDVKTFTKDEPELLVRMYRESVDGHAVKESVFDLPQFTQRLQHMREVYHNVQTNQQATTMEKQLDVPDPWAVCSYHEFQRLQKELKERDDHIARLLQVAREDKEAYMSGIMNRSSSQPSFGNVESPSRKGRSKTPQTPRGAGGGIRAAVANGSWTPHSCRANSLTPSVSDDACWGNTGHARLAAHRWDDHRRFATARLPHRWGDGTLNVLSPRRQEHTWLRGVQPRFGTHAATYAQRSRALTPRRGGLNWKP